MKELKVTSEQCSLIILSGEAEVGKTAVVKDLYDEVKEEKPFFAFRATAFNISHINQLFQNYGSFTFSDFIDEHKEAKEKYMVINSAERLSRGFPDWTIWNKMIQGSSPLAMLQ